MGDDLSSLSEGDLDRLLQVIESLERSPFDFLQLEVGGMRVVIGKGNPADHGLAVTSVPPAAGAAPTAPAAPAAPAALAPVGGHDGAGSATAEVTAVPVAVGAPAASTPPAGEASAEVTVEIRSPMMGVFYAQPEPGAPPYVSVGSVVDPETTVALVEVMKMFNAVPAGVSGTVVAVLAENAQLVEYGQPLFRVHPS